MTGYVHGASVPKRPNGLEFRQLRDELARRDQQIEELKRTLSRSRSTIGSLRAGLDSSMKSTRSLRGKVEALEAEATSLHEENKRLRSIHGLPSRFIRPRLRPGDTPEICKARLEAAADEAWPIRRLPEVPHEVLARGEAA